MKTTSKKFDYKFQKYEQKNTINTKIMTKYQKSKHHEQKIIKSRTKKLPKKS